MYFVLNLLSKFQEVPFVPNLSHGYLAAVTVMRFFARAQMAVLIFVNMQAQSCEGRTPAVRYTHWNRDEQLAFCKAHPSRGHAYLDL